MTSAPDQDGDDMRETTDITEPARDPSSHGATTIRKARRAIRARLLAQTLAFAALTYAAMVLYYLDVLPLWGLIAANVLFYIRSYLRMHDLCHAFSTKGWVVRFVPTALFANPVWGGTTAFITTHVQHHLYLGSNQDPWLNYYIGHPLRALCFNMIEPEWNLCNFVRQGRVNRKFLENIAFDVARHALNLVLFQGAYLVHMIVQRTCHGLGVFLFNFWPHRERWSAAAAIGSFNRERELTPWAPLLRAFFGRALVEAGMYHNRHHVLDQMLEPSHRYVLLKDEGVYTRHNDRWPLRAVQFLASGPQTPPQG
jgi:fatty acid desaturase